MTDEEKTQLRIEAARVMGWEVDLVDVRRLPNPLDNPADYEALLLKRLCSGWRIELIEFYDPADYCFPGEVTKAPLEIRCHVVLNRRHPHAMQFGMPSGIGQHTSKITAYREAMTKACVATWQAENNRQSSCD